MALPIVRFLPVTAVENMDNDPQQAQTSTARLPHIPQGQGQGHHVMPMNVQPDLSKPDYPTTSTQANYIQSTGSVNTVTIYPIFPGNLPGMATMTTSGNIMAPSTVPGTMPGVTAANLMQSYIAVQEDRAPKHPHYSYIGPDGQIQNQHVVQHHGDSRQIQQQIPQQQIGSSSQIQHHGNGRPIQHHGDGHVMIQQQQPQLQQQQQQQQQLQQLRQKQQLQQQLHPQQQQQPLPPQQQQQQLQRQQQQQHIPRPVPRQRPKQPQQQQHFQQHDNSRQNQQHHLVRQSPQLQQVSRQSPQLEQRQSPHEQYVQNQQPPTQHQQLQPRRQEADEAIPDLPVLQTDQPSEPANQNQSATTRLPVYNKRGQIIGESTEEPDDIIQKSLAMSGISQDMIETREQGSPQPEAPIMDVTHHAVLIEDSAILIENVESVNENDFNTPTESHVEPPENAAGEPTEKPSQEPISHECTKCEQTFDTSDLLEEHEKEHTGSYPFQCVSCNKRYQEIEQLAKHVIGTCGMVVKPKPFACEHDGCEKTFSTKAALSRHISQHTLPHQCDQCDKAFSTERALQKHQATDHKPPTPEPETTVSELEEDESDVYKSLRKRKARKVRQVITIDDSGDDSDPLVDSPNRDVAVKLDAVRIKDTKPRKKVRTETRKRYIPVTEYKKRGPKPKLKPQIVKKKKFRCGRCDMSFNTGEERTAHVQIHVASVGEKEYMCSQCGKSYTMVCNLERHILVHSNTRLHRCDVCGKGFTRVDILDRHRRIHTGEKPHECDQCHTRFISSSALMVHKKRVHIDRPFRCSKCPDAFTSQEKLTRHSMMHSSSRKYSCDECGKSFINSSNLKTHIRTHTKERPFRCEHCGERFTQKAHVDRHVIIHTKPKKPSETLPNYSGPLESALSDIISQLHYCKICGKSFPKRRGLRMHERMRHQIAKPKPVKPQPPPQQMLQNHLQMAQMQPQQIQQILQPLQPPPIQQTQQPGLSYQLNNVSQPATVYNNVYTPQYLPNATMYAPQQWDIQIHNANTVTPGQDDSVIFTASDSHDTIMYLIEAASNLPNQQQTQQTHDLTPLVQHRFDQDINTVQIHQNGNLQIQIQPNQLQEVQVHEVQQVIQNPVQVQQPAPVQNPATIQRKQKRPRPPVANRQPRVPGQKPFHCQICGENFGSSGVLVKHMRIHTGEKPYKCDVCGKSFAQIGNLHRHTKSHQGVRNHACTVCGKTFTRKERLLYHAKLHTGTKNFECNECGRQFIHKINLVMHHNRRHNPDKKFKCDLCDKAFAEARALAFHKRTHGPKPDVEKNHICNTCGRAFSDMKRLLKHARVHTNVRPHKCPDCGKSYTLASSLRNHIAVHHDQSSVNSHKDPETLRCPICQKMYAHKYQLQNHLRFHANDGSLKCTVCEKTFSVSTNLTAHMRIHTGEKPYECSICGQGFKQRCHLLRHAKTCQKRKFKCAECGKTFAQLTSLSNHHKLQHTPEENNFNCAICEVGFGTKNGLTRHMKKVHSEQSSEDGVITIEQSTQNMCEKCGEKFSETKELDAHKLSDTCSEKAFKCSTCDQTFTNAHLWTEHEFEHNPHGCSDCNLQFKTAELLQKHRDSHHDLKTSNREHKRKRKFRVCEKCDETVDVSEYKAHMQSHLDNDKPHECEDCGQKLRSKTQVDRHKRSCRGKTDANGKKKVSIYRDTVPELDEAIEDNIF